jgi:hypothetical protein
MAKDFDNRYANGWLFPSVPPERLLRAGLLQDDWGRTREGTIRVTFHCSLELRPAVAFGEFPELVGLGAATSIYAGAILLRNPEDAQEIIVPGSSGSIVNSVVVLRKSFTALMGPVPAPIIFINSRCVSLTII